MNRNITTILILLCFNANVILAQVKEMQPYITVEGAVTNPLKLAEADLLKMQHITVAAKGKDGQLTNYTGASVEEILQLAGVTINKELHGENLAKYLLVKCADGYQVVFSLAELDSSLNDKVAILAYESDGKALPAGKGPFRLVVPNEKRPARSSFQVIAFIIRSAKE